MQRRHVLALACAPAAASGWAAGNAGAAAGGELVFGQSAVLGGLLGQQVQQLNAGAQLVFDDVNASGAVPGHKLRLHTMDDQLDPQRALQAYKTLLQQQQVFGLFGCVGTATTAAAEPILRESGAVAFGGYAVADSVRRQCQGAAYFVRASYGRECEALVQQLTTIGINRIGVAHLANPGGDETLQLIRQALAQRKVEIAVSAAVNNEGGNVSEVARKLMALQPQAVLMFLAGPLAAELMDTMRRLGGRPSFYGLSIVTGEQVIKRLGEQARGLAIAQVMPYPWHEADPDLIKYRRLAQAAKVPVGYASLEGYVNARVLVEALQRCGGEYSRARLHAVLRKMQWRFAGLDLDFGSPANPGTGSRFVDLVQITAAGRYLR